MVATMLKAWAVAAILSMGVLAGAPAWAECRMVNVGEIPAVVQRGRILIPSEINGQKAYFILDTGADQGELFYSAATRLGVHTRAVSTADAGREYGIGGEVLLRWGEIEKLKLGPLVADRVNLPVAMDTHEEREGVAGLIGFNVFNAFDVELDLAHGVIRLLKTSGCSDDQMDYWRAPYAVAPIRWRGGGDRHIYVPIRLNGAPLEAIVDTGSPETTVTLAGAARAGVRPGSPDVRQIGMLGGVAGDLTPVYAARFKSFQIGEEKIDNPTLQTADMFGHTLTISTGTLVPTEDELADMLVGLDFLKAHRVLISHANGKMYFSYLGGPIFEPPVVAKPASAPAAKPSAAGPPPAAHGDTP